MSESISGSGSLLGLFDDPQRARRARAALEAEGINAFRCRTLSLDQYRGAWRRSLGRVARGTR